MSVTFSVYPSKKQIPTFQEVVDLSTKKLNAFLREREIKFDIEITVSLFERKEAKEQKVDLNSLAKWDNDLHFAWFTVSSVKGGTEAFYWVLTDEEKKDYKQEILDDVDYLGENFNVIKNGRKDLVEKCFETGYEWHFKNWASQPCMVSASFGFIASSFAELTDGIIFSSDGGWEHQIFPATADEFDECYFRPEKIISDDLLRRGVEDCIEDIAFELKI